MRMNITLNTDEDCVKFCEIAGRFDNDIDIMYSHYILDAKRVPCVQGIPRGQKLEIRILGIESIEPKIVESYIEAFKEFTI